MSEIDLIRNLRNSYPNITSLNEAETRFNIIDEILEKYLKWPKNDTAVEKVIEGNRADYVLKNQAGKPILIIETKKTGIYFDLPNSFNSGNNTQRILIEKLLTDDPIKNAITQVKEYCEDTLCQYAAVTNGLVWILFKTTATNQKPWKKLHAIVIKGLEFFQENYTEAINLLGYTSIISHNSLQQNVGVTRKTYSDVFFPKHKINTYDSPVNSNKYASSLSSLARKFLGTIPFDDSEFMDSCYVTNKGHHDSLQKDIHGFLFDSITPFFKNQGFKEFIDDKEGGAFGRNIAKVIRQENLDNVMILFGGRGSGKSTFLKRFLFYVKPLDIFRHAEVALVDLIDSSQNEAELGNEIWERVKKGIDKKNIASGSREEIIKLFQDEFEIYSNQILVGLEESSEEYQKLLRSFLLEKLADTKLFSEKISLTYKARNKGLIIFLDNMDQLNPELQDTCYLTAVEIAKKLSCLVIISMREERYYRAKVKGVLDAYHTPGFHLSAPIIPQVLVRRLKFILEKLTYDPDVDIKYGIMTDADLLIIKNFLNICTFQLSKPNSNLSNFVRFATHGDVRQALEFFKGFITSGYTNITEISNYPYWTFQIHQVIKPMMIPDRNFYDEGLSKIPNLFRLRNDVNSSHFTGIRTLHELAQVSTANSAGFVDAKLFLQNFDEKYYHKEDCEKHLSVFLKNGLVESSNRLESFSEKVDQIKITAYGQYVFKTLAFDFTYIDLVCIDSGVFDEELANYLVSSANEEFKLKYAKKILDRMDMRIERADKYITYLEKQEEEEFVQFQISTTEHKFTVKIREAFEKEKKKVMDSAKKNQ